MTQPTEVADDLLEGADAIRDFLGIRTRSRIYYLLESGELKAFKLGGRWCARKSTLLRQFQEMEG